MVVMADIERRLDGRPFTVADLDSTPADGRRYELLDGALLVTPAPGWAHHRSRSGSARPDRRPPPGLTQPA